ncbi:MAG: hypothetical protein FWF36_01840 [Propionibacteriaceae bacterium]|nr:hypothetical protein [Propionibacteriaceae bacterium]
MRVVLSRKGFDSQYGRIPSPILPDGTLLSLPIPTSAPGRRFAELTHGGVTYEQIITDLGGDIGMAAGFCHLDPDLRRGEAVGWVPAFGQVNAAQTHLANQGVGVGDLFLFFGRYRQTDLVDGHLRYVRQAPVLHIVFGYLQVGQVVQGDAVREYPWHPHAGYDACTNNTLYVAADHLLGTALPGGGTLACRDNRVLTAPGHRMSQWLLLDWMRTASISYHSPASLHDDYFQSAAKGQEFVIDDNPNVHSWASRLLADTA